MASTTPYRVTYLKQHIEQMKAAMELDGVPVMGYNTLGLH